MANILSTLSKTPFIALDLAKRVVRLILRLLRPTPRGYGDLADQARRAAISVALNLSEGQGREGGARMRHYSIALGSAKEAATALELLIEVGAVSPKAGREALLMLDELCAVCWRLVHPRR